MADLKISQLTGATTPLAGTEVLPVVQSSTTKQVSVANLTAGRAVSAGSLALTSSPLPVTSGGTGTATAFTAGSVVFAGASGVYTQANTNFFWDAANNRLGLGTATPATGFHLFNTTARPFTAGNNSATWSFGQSGANFAFRENSSATDFVSIDGNNGNTTFSVGNLVQGTAAKGVNFTANTPAAGMTSQLLNWYEEGTWTPAFEFATPGNASFTYTTQTGWYTRIGNLVTVQFAVVVSATTVGTGSGNLLLAGLPFTSKTGLTQSGVISYASGYTTNMPTTVEVASASAKLVFISQPATAAGTVITNTNVPAGATSLYGAITYMV